MAHSAFDPTDTQAEGVAPHKLGMVAHTYNLSPWEVEAVGSEVQSYLQLHREFKAHRTPPKLNIYKGKKGIHNPAFLHIKLTSVHRIDYKMQQRENTSAGLA